MDDALDTMGEIRPRTAAPFIFFSYFNPIHKYGTERFVKRAAEVGFDGLLIVDLPFEEAHHLKPLSDKEGLAWIYLITPTTTRDRIKRMDEAGTGFLYYVSVTGVTGVRQELPTDVMDRCDEIRDACSLPLVVGFGISGAVQASQLKKHVDGVVAGSSIVKMISEEKYGLKLKSYVQEMKAALS
jgi:tryptophan synthase alpha chain